jgi:hypothetical protein
MKPLSRLTPRSRSLRNRTGSLIGSQYWGDWVTSESGFTNQGTIIRDNTIQINSGAFVNESDATMITHTIQNGPTKSIKGHLINLGQMPLNPASG